MAQAYKCDRCRRLYEVNPVSHENEQIYSVTKSNGQTFDLCGNCQRELGEFLMVNFWEDDKKGEEKRITDFTPIDELGLSTRSFNCLTRADIHTVGDVCNAYFNGSLEKVRNLGRNGYKEIKLKLISAGKIDGG